jgi:uncharacterized protein (DUF2252 family)
VTDRPLSNEDEAIAERIGWAAARDLSRFWLNEAAKIEEEVDNPRARWDLLKQAMAIVARGSGWG